MIKDITIKNFKSIAEMHLSLGNVNVFIGANGSGKSNILEAFGMIAAERSCRIDLEDMVKKGIRIAKPNLMVNSFEGQNVSPDIKMDIQSDEGDRVVYDISNKALMDIYSGWEVDEKKESWGALTSTGTFRADSPNDIEETSGKAQKLAAYIQQYLIYSIAIDALRGLTPESSGLTYPLGIKGQGLDVFLNTLSEDEICQIKEIAMECISWIGDIFFDEDNRYKLKGYKLGRSISNLYFRDKYMLETENLLSAENANEGALELLFYLTLFISKRKPLPDFFAVDNIETGLNPRLCRLLIKKITGLAVEKGKQALITTHNPAVLDGLDLSDDTQRLYIVTRNDEGQTIAKRIRTKPKVDGGMKLSEMWMNGLIGGLPDNF